ncbi:MAG: cbb3-type cytochrome c oxidase subunit II [candidate division NC10 bacterium]|nr:cbb3-type cytochrome c oxidase subunit II [candidate division NC10 bacterium]
MSRRWLWAFAILGLLNAILFLAALWRDYDREWKRYQTAFFALEGRKARTAREEEAVKGRRHEFIQIPVAGSTRMDRCMMCHLGVEDPRFADAPQPFRTHPEIPKHPFEKFGCTVCHGGQDMATTTPDAHGRVPFWDEPLLEGAYRQSSCGACHLGKDPTGAPVLAEGRQLYQQRGCVACHRIRGAGGIMGPDLTFVGSRRRDPEWHLRHLREPQATSPGSSMPPFAHLSEAELKALTVYMLSLREMPSALLASTPLPASTPAAAAPPGATGKPSLTARAPAPGPGIAAPAVSAPERLGRGKALYSQKGCAACHAIGGVGGQVGPDLSVEGGKPGRDMEWHLRHFRNPPAVVPGSIMPPLSDLTENDLKALAEYMLSLRELPR